MKDLGVKIKNSDLYPSMAGEDKETVRYPHVTLPLSLLGKDVDLEQEVMLTLKGKVKRLEKSEYAEEFSVELIEGECYEEKKKA